ncbi:MAG: hypothetical protein H0T53_08270 [Herpetosiphonaceae bacterium]|nr:hypothetical protein [Herpetosiphonaceae bacterium]
MWRWRHLLIFCLWVILSSCSSSAESQTRTPDHDSNQQAVSEPQPIPDTPVPVPPVTTTPTALAVSPTVPSPVAVSPSPTFAFSPILTDHLPVDLPWVMGLPDELEPYRLLAIAPAGRLLMLQDPIQYAINRPGQTPLVLWSDHETVIVRDPATGREQSLQLDPGEYIYSTFTSDGRNLLLISANNVIRSLNFETGTTTKVAVIVQDLSFWNYPQILLQRENTVYISTYASATRLLWRVQLDAPQARPEQMVVMGHGGSFWLDPHGSSILYYQAMAADTGINALDLITGTVTPFTGSLATLQVVDQELPILRLPGSNAAFSVVYTP